MDYLAISCSELSYLQPAASDFPRHTQVGQKSVQVDLLLAGERRAPHQKFAVLPLIPELTQQTCKSERQ
jgi:hypothetical protein